MENPIPSRLKYIMNYGAMTGLAIIVCYILFYILNVKHDSAINYVNYLLIIGGIILGTKAFRDQALGGFISYSKALSTGTGIAFFSSVLAGFYTYIFFSFIDPGAMGKIIEQVEEQMYQQGKSDDEIELAMRYVHQLMTPASLTVFIMVAYTFMGFLFSLGISFFLKKESDTFDAQINE